MTATKKRTDKANPKTVLAWHFLTGTSGTLRDGSAAPKDGEWLEHSGELEMCNSGLHASVKPFDAVTYAPGNIVCRVECGGTIVHGDDKLVCSRRKILWRADAEATLRAFARWCAIQVIHLWDAPQIVREYLETGDESKRAAARAAAWDAAKAAAWAAQNGKLEEMLLALAPKES